MPRNEDGARGGGGGDDKNICNVPAKGWQYADTILLNEGVAFNVRYIGCVEIKTSMKMMDFTMRSLVAKECITRVCEGARLITPKKRTVDKQIDYCICPKPRLENAGCDVTLTVCSRFLSLRNLETNEAISNYDMPRISFASGGDTDTLDFVAFVAKDLQEWRACYVLECGGGQAQDLISTIGQAFELRYNEYFNKTQDNENLNTSKDYYNDLPGKLPPELLDAAAAMSKKNKQQRERLSSNLIDLNSPPPMPPDHEYVNEKSDGLQQQQLQNGSTAVSKSTGAVLKSTMAAPPPPPSTSQHPIRDVFDLQPCSLTAEVQRSQLQTESWFHGVISRPVAESLLNNNGDFLVRESKAKPGQYVLTGLQMLTPKHLLLIDPEGVVRTKDRIFDSITHLINYHWTNALPIISEESALVLRKPVLVGGGSATSG